MKNDLLRRADVPQIEKQNEISRMQLEMKRGNTHKKINGVYVEIAQYIQGLKQSLDTEARYNPYDNQKVKAIKQVQDQIRSNQTNSQLKN